MNTLRFTLILTAMTALVVIPAAAAPTKKTKASTETSSPEETKEDAQASVKIFLRPIKQYTIQSY